MSKRTAPEKPRPDRAALDIAEAALSDADALHRRAMQDLSVEIDRLETQRRKLEAASERDIANWRKRDQPRKRVIAGRWTNGAAIKR